MKTREYIGKLTTGKWTRMTVLAIAAFIVFGYLYSRGVSPVWTAVAIVCFRGFFRFIYRIACWLRRYCSASSVTWSSDNTGP